MKRTPRQQTAFDALRSPLPKRSTSPMSNMTLGCVTQAFAEITNTMREGM